MSHSCGQLHYVAVCYSYMVDAADHDKIEASKNEFHNLLDKPQLNGIPVLVLANKRDLPGALDEREVIDRMYVNCGIHSNQNNRSFFYCHTHCPSCYLCHEICNCKFTVKFTFNSNYFSQYSVVAITCTRLFKGHISRQTFLSQFPLDSIPP